MPKPWTADHDREFTALLRSMGTVPAESYYSLVEAYHALEEECCRERREARRARSAFVRATVIAGVMALVAVWAIGAWLK